MTHPDNQPGTQTAADEDELSLKHRSGAHILTIQPQHIKRRRMALVARPADVQAMVTRQAFAMVGAGQLIGLAGAFALTCVLSTFLV